MAPDSDLALRPAASGREAVLRNAVLPVSLALALVALVFFSAMPLASDVTFFIASADRILDGAKPYVDIIETNPPLGFWITQPAAWVARVSGLALQTAYVAWVCVLSGGALWLMSRIYADTRAAPDVARRILVTSAAALLVFPLSAFGQREHLAIILLLPYLALQSQRADGCGASPGVMLLAGLLAGIGSSFKPYFLLIAGLVEVYLLVQSRDARQLFRIDSLALVAVAAGYPVAVWLITPEYFTRIVPLALLTYSAFSIELWKAVLGIRYPVVLPILIVVLAAAFRKDGAAIKVWAVAALGAYAGYAVQSKGFVYQLLPALILLVIAAVQLVRDLRLTPVWFAAVLALAVGHGTYSVLFYLEEFHKRAVFAELFQGRPGGTLMALSFDIGVKFPFLLDGDKRWADSYPGLWMLPAINKNMLTPEQKNSVVAQATAIVTSDLQHYQPDFVLVDVRGDLPATAEKPLPYLQMFGSSPAFNEQWRSYVLTRETGGLQLWTRIQ